VAASYNQPIFTKATNLSFPHSRLITGFVTRSTRRVPLVERELYTLPEHQSSPPVLSGVRVTRSLVLCVCFIDRCLSFCLLSFCHCVLFSYIYNCWFPLRFDPTFLHRKRVDIINEYAINFITLSDLKCLNTHWSNGQHYLVVALTVVLHHSHNN
jgi:hypothetical protein